MKRLPRLDLNLLQIFDAIYTKGGVSAAASHLNLSQPAISHAVAKLHPQRSIHRVVLVGTAASRFDVASVPSELQLRTLALHGEQDDTVPLDSVLDWARPQGLPVTVVPGGGHFFHGQLPLLRELVVRHLNA